MTTHSSILLIDDSQGECELFRLALGQSGFDVKLYTEHDAEAALHLLTDRAGRAPLPSVILLDWHLQKQHGDEFLRRLRADHRLRSIPVVVFTTSDDASDLAASYTHGTNGYAVKPGTFEELVRFATDFCRYWIDWNRTPYRIETRC
jgi:two-component system, chemotaxis family, response regulator Rcp1